MSLNRRSFIGLTGGALGAAALGGTAWGSLLEQQVALAQESGSGRVLVIVQCNGGNDGLNTLVPVEDGRYYDLRPGLAIAEADASALSGAGGLGLHPSLAPLNPMWTVGDLALVQGVAFEGQTRSHFVAQDVWAAGVAGEPPTTGWLGRWLDATGDGSNPLRGISLGGGPPLLRGKTIQATHVGQPATFDMRIRGGNVRDAVVEAFLASSVPVAADPALLAASRASLPPTFEAVDLLDEASGGSQGLGDESSVTSLLDTAASIIELDVGTEVFVIGTGGFDTHAEQPGTHAGLLADVAGGIAAFYGRLEEAGRADDVVVMTVSEFGRRVAENASAGTDHGYGGTQFMCGPAVTEAQVVGAVDLANLDDGDVAFDIDTRSMYAAALDWMGGPTEEVLGGSFDTYSLLTG